MAEYNVVLADIDGAEVASTMVEGLAAAKKHAKYFLTTVYAERLGTSHAALGTHKVEVRDQADVCHWDAFLETNQ